MSGRFYNAVVVPAVNLGVRWLSRVCLLAAAGLVFAILAGWTR